MVTYPSTNKPSKCYNCQGKAGKQAINLAKTIGGPLSAQISLFKKEFCTLEFLNVVLLDLQFKITVPKLY
jgi:hypothetical protein